MNTFLVLKTYLKKQKSSILSKSLLLLAIVSTAVFASCSDSDSDEAQTYQVKVSLVYPNGVENLSKSDVEVKATNSQTGAAISGKTDATGAVTFNLISGLYNFTTSQESNDFAYNGILERVVVSENKELSIDLVATSLSGGLVIKEIYYVGSKTLTDGNYMSDQFIEIYNNSDEIIYLDNIGIGTTDPITSNTPSLWVDANGVLPNTIPLWGYSFYIKGSGKDHPLAPRTSIVIAQDGIDHKTDPVGNPNSPVNLGNASWETYVGDINGGKDADAVAVPNMTVLHTTSTTLNDFMLSVFGPGLILFQFPEGVDPAAFASNNQNLLPRPGDDIATTYLQIPKEYVVDAVECVNFDSGKRNKRIPSDLDAGVVFTDNTYTGKSVRRKVKQVVDGKVVYKDTNNSTEDFLNNQIPAPFVHSTQVDN